ncbi:hypothetical protein KAJ41_00300 [Candidatus Parcubacteria bacterium]|nr:hypothetical protein [Candidatus Parcubacteria bacterium]
MKIVIGFDDTIFNTYKLTKEFIRHLKKSGFRSEEFKRIYIKAKDKKEDFDQKELIGLFDQIDSSDKEKVINEIKLSLESSKKFIYPDFYKFVDNYRRKNLILLSSASTDFQKLKIDNSGVSHFFDKIYFTPDRKIEVLQKIYHKYPTDRVFFVDDKASEIDEVEKKIPGIVTIKIDRARGVYVNQKSKISNFVVKNLKQTNEIIQDLTNKIN